MGTHKRSSSASNFAVSDTHGLVDLQTGELLPVMEQKRKSGKRYDFMGAYVLMGVLNMSKLMEEADLSATGMRLAWKLVKIGGYAGICQVKTKDLARELGVDRSQITRLVQELERYDLVRRIGTGHRPAIAINPRFAFMGTPDEHHRALERWAALNPPELVRRSA